METITKDIHHDLIEACRHDDRKAQMQVYDLYYRSMFNTSLRIVNDVAEAEDVMQDSFIEAFKKIDTFRGEGSFGMWLRRIVVNKSITAIRKRKPTVSIDENEMELQDPADGEKELSENKFYRLEEIRNGMKHLPDTHRLILSLHLIEGYDHREIAGILNTTYGNVRTRYSRAKQKLLQTIMELRNKKMKS